MKTLIVVSFLIVGLTGIAGAWNVSKNPDVSPSIGWGIHGGRLPGILSDNAPYTELAVDVRSPITNYLSLSFDFSQTTVSNAPLGVSTESNRIGASVRVYLSNVFGE